MNRSFIGALCFSAVLPLLAGCGGSQPPIGAPGAMAQSRAIAGTNAIVHRISLTSSYQVLHSFAGGSDGAHPQARLIDVKGTLYGTTAEGGGSGCKGAVGCGIIFTISTSGSENVLYSFRGRPLDGSFPYSRLLDVNGTLYGTTTKGGDVEACAGNCGALYSISTTGTETVLHNFDGGTKDGAYPIGGLIDVKGTLYGATERGGARDGPGTVYRISTAGVEKLLYRFVLGGGAYPMAGLTAVKGTLYGTTLLGCNGKSCGSSCGCGTVYSISTTGVEKVLYEFKGGSDGGYPRAPLIDVNGTLYGTTSWGGGGSGCVFGCGVVYRVSTNGKFKVLYRFAGGSDGGQPYAGLINVNGTLYGTTYEGGGSSACSGGCGTVYSISTTGTENVLYSFAGGSDGVNPIAPLLDVNGTLYGTTVHGGGLGCSKKTDGCGTVFALTP